METPESPEGDNGPSSESLEKGIKLAVSRPLGVSGDITLIKSDQSLETLTDETHQNVANPPTLAELVDTNILSQLLDMGFSEAQAGRALLATKSRVSLEAALTWFEQHEDDDNIDVPLSPEELVAQNTPLPRHQLSEEEAQRLAYELQTRLRDERLKREKQENIDRERLRLQQSKALLEQNAKLEEEQRKRAVAQLQREKADSKKERERQRELLRQDYRDRFGCEMPEEGSQTDSGERVSKMSGKEKAAYFSNALMRRYKVAEPQKLLVCLSTLRSYAGNLKENPTDPKYRQIRKENAAFSARVLPLEGSLEFLDACGFKDQGDILAIVGQPDGFVLAQALKFLDLLIGQLGQK